MSDPALLVLASLAEGATIAEILGDKRKSLQDICSMLIETANAGGGPDNITALVLEVDVS